MTEITSAVPAPSPASTLCREPAKILAALDSVPMDLEGSADAWGHHGGRDLSRLESDALLIGDCGDLSPEAAAIPTPSWHPSR